ncbi:arsenate reductase (glutaredoxin) [Haemophilus paracuniculus]|uniref:Arsenate reductase n=1 Tax=Haemophilus paracuniculus TaxID=734 RepID=A0A1T0AU97_9PAST|nr:arsenate reductase (glutaredoxin) [Haemophilus paracuniculus]OOS00164.1 arsenate reductase (glutaredoxin) [Haemophilus paracuniculus]
MEKVKIYHNPKCGTSRNTLKLLEHLGLQVEVIYYLDTPPTVAELTDLLAEMKMSPTALLRKNVPEYEQLNMAENRYSDQELISKMVEIPILINRPIVVTSLGTKLCRPSEEVLTILPIPLTEDFIKEDGEVIKANKV